MGGGRVGEVSGEFGRTGVEGRILRMGGGETILECGGGDVACVGEKTLGAGAKGGGDRTRGGGEKTRCGEGRTGEGDVGREEDMRIVVVDDVDDDAVMIGNVGFPPTRANSRGRTRSLFRVDPTLT